MLNRTNEQFERTMIGSFGLFRPEISEMGVLEAFQRVKAYAGLAILR